MCVSVSLCVFVESAAARNARPRRWAPEFRCLRNMAIFKRWRPRFMRCLGDGCATGSSCARPRRYRVAVSWVESGLGFGGRSRDCAEQVGERMAGRATYGPLVGGARERGRLRNLRRLSS